MGNRAWGKGYHTGHDKGFTKGVIITTSIFITHFIILNMSNYITTRKLKAEKIIEKKENEKIIFKL